MPNDLIIVNKSLELFLNTFRNHSILSEECAVGICTKLVDELKKFWLKISTYWYLPSGIPVRVFCQTAKKPINFWLPVQNIPDYK